MALVQSGTVYSANNQPIQPQQRANTSQPKQMDNQQRLGNFLNFRKRNKQDDEERKRQQSNVPNGMHRAGGLTEFMADVADFGDKIYQLSGFDGEDYQRLMSLIPNMRGKDTNIFGVDADQKYSLPEYAQSAWDFLKSLPAGMASAPFSAVSKMYQGITGENLTQSEQAADGTHMISDEKLDTGERAASFVDGAIDGVGLALGGSGRVLGMLGKGMQEGAMLGNAVARASRAGRSTEALTKMQNAHKKLSDALEGPKAIREAGPMAKAAYDIAQEGSEEFVQQSMENIYTGNGTWFGDNGELFGGTSVFNPDNGYLSEALGAGALGAVGGGVFTGVSQGIPAGMRYIAQKDAERRNASSGDNVTNEPTPDVPDFTTLPGNGRPDWLPVFADADLSEGVEPGVSPKLNIGGNRHVRIDSATITLGNIRRDIMADAHNIPSIAAQFGFNTDEERRQFTDLMLRPETSALVNGIIAQQYNGNIAGYLTDRAKSNNGKILLWKEPASNPAGAQWLRIQEVLDNPSQFVSVNTALNDTLNADADGDKYKVSWNDNLVRAYSPTSILSKLTLGTNRLENGNRRGEANAFDADYSYFNRDRNQYSGIVDSIRGVLTGAGVQDEIANDVISAYSDAINGTHKSSEDRAEAERLFLDRTYKALNDAANGDEDAASALFADIFEHVQIPTRESSNEAVQARFDSSLATCLTNLQAADSTFLNIDRNADPNSTVGELSTIEALIYGGALNGDYKEFAKSLFRAFQSQYLGLKRVVNDGAAGTSYEVLYQNAFDLFMAWTANLADLGSVPTDALTSLFNAGVEENLDTNIKEKFNFSTWDDFKEWLTEDFKESYNKLAKQYNDAISIRIMGDSRKRVPFGVSEKKMLDSESDCIAAFFNIYKDSAEVAQKLFPEIAGTNRTLEEHIRYLSSQRFHQSTISAGPNPDFQNKIMEKLKEANAGVYGRVDAQTNALVDSIMNIATANDYFSEGITTDNYSAMAALATSIVHYLGKNEALAYNFGDMSTIINHPFMVQLLNAARNRNKDEVNNALERATIESKYADAIKLMNEIQSSDNVEIEVVALLRQTVLKNLGTSQLHQYIVDDLLKRIDEGNYDFSSSLAGFFASPNHSYREKLEQYEILSGGLDNPQPLLASSLVIDSSSIAMSSLSKSLAEAQRVATGAEKLYTAELKQQIQNAMTLCNTRNLNFMSVCREMLRRQHSRVASSALSGTLYTQIHGFDAAVAEKGKSMTGSQAFQQQVSMANGKYLSPYTEDITDRAMGAIDSRALASDMNLLLEILFDKDAEIYVFSVAHNRRERATQASLFKTIVGHELANPQNGMDDGEWVELLQHKPELVTYLNPTNLVSRETANGVQTVEASSEDSFTNAVANFIEEDMNKPTYMRVRNTVEQLAMRNPSIMQAFVSTLPGRDSDRPIYTITNPKEFSAVISGKWSNFVDWLAGEVISNAKKIDSATLENIVNEAIGEPLKTAFTASAQALQDFSRYTQAVFANDVYNMNIVDFAQEVERPLRDAVGQHVGELAVLKTIRSRIATFVESSGTWTPAPGVRVSGDTINELTQMIDQIERETSGIEDIPEAAMIVGDGTNIANDSGTALDKAHALMNAGKIYFGITRVMQENGLSPMSSPEVLADALANKMKAFQKDFWENDFLRAYALTRYIQRQSSEIPSIQKGPRNYTADELKSLAGVNQFITYLQDNNENDLVALVTQLIDNDVVSINPNTISIDSMQQAWEWLQPDAMNSVFDIILNNIPVIDTQLEGMLHPLRTSFNGKSINKNNIREINGLGWERLTNNLSENEIARVVDEEAKILSQAAQNADYAPDTSVMESEIKSTLTNIYRESDQAKRIEKYVKYNESFERGIAIATISKCSTSPMSALNPRMFDWQNDSRDALSGFLKECFTNTTMLEDGSGDILSAAVSIAEGEYIKPSPIEFHFSDNVLARIAERTSFESFAAYVPSQVGTEGALQELVGAYASLKAIPREHSCSVSPTPLSGSLSDRNNFGKNIVVPEAVIANSDGLQAAVLERGVEIGPNGPGVMLQLNDYTSRELVRNGAAAASSDIYVYEQDVCLGGPCAHHDMGAYDGGGLPRVNSTYAEQNFLASVDIIRALLAHNMEARVLKAKKKYNLKAQTILHVAPSSEGVVNRNMTSQSQVDVADAAAMLGEFYKAKASVQKYWADMFKDADGELGSLGFGDEQAWALANLFCRAVTITFVGPSGNTETRTVDASIMQDAAAWSAAITGPEGYSVKQVEVCVLGVKEMANKIAVTELQGQAEARANGQEYTSEALGRDALRALTDWSAYSTLSEDNQIIEDEDGFSPLADVVKRIGPRKFSYATSTIPIPGEGSALQKFLGLTKSSTLGGTTAAASELVKFGMNQSNPNAVRQITDRDAIGLYEEMTDHLLGGARQLADKAKDSLAELFGLSTPTPIVSAKGLPKISAGFIGKKIKNQMSDKNFGRFEQNWNHRSGDGHIISLGSENTALAYLPDTSDVNATEAKKAMRRAIVDGQSIYMTRAAFEAIENDRAFFPVGVAKISYLTSLHKQLVRHDDKTELLLIDTEKLCDAGKFLPGSVSLPTHELNGNVFVGTAADIPVGNSVSMLNINSVSGLDRNVSGGYYEAPFADQFDVDMSAYGVRYEVASADDIASLTDEDLEGGTAGILDINFISRKLSGHLDRQQIRNRVRSYVRTVQERGATYGPNQEIGKHECACLVKRTDIYGNVRYAPIILADTNMSEKVRIGTIAASDGKVAFRISGSDKIELGDTAKGSLAYQAYKTESIVESERAFRQIAYPHGAGNRRADMHFDAAALIGRLEGMISNKLQTTLHYSMFLFKTSMWKDLSSSTTSPQPRSDLKPEFQDSAMQTRLQNGEIAAYNEVLLSGGPLNEAAASDEHEAEIIRRQNKAICKVIRACMDYRDVPFADIFARTRPENGSSNEYKTSQTDFAFRFITNGLNCDELLLFYSAIAPGICPRGFTDKADGSNGPSSDTTFLDHAGRVLQFNETTQTWERVETVIGNYNFTAPQINTLTSGVGRLSDQTFMDNALQWGVNDDSVDRYMKNMSVAIKDYGAVYAYNKNAQREDFMTRYRAGEDTETSYVQERLLENDGAARMTFLQRMRSVRWTKKYQDTINTIQHDMPVVTESQDIESANLEYRVQELTRKVNQALGRDPNDVNGWTDRLIKQFFMFATCWTRGTGRDGEFGTNITFDALKNVIDDFIADIEAGRVPLSSRDVLDMDSRFSAGCLSPEMCRILAESPIFKDNGITYDYIVDEMVKKLLSQRQKAEGLMRPSEHPKKKALKDFMDSVLIMHGKYDELESNLLLGDMSYKELVDFYCQWGNVLGYDSGNMKDVWRHDIEEVTRNLKHQAEYNQRKEERRARVGENTDAVSPDKTVTTFGGYAAKGSLLNKAMILMQPLIAAGSAVDRFTRSYGQRVTLAMMAAQMSVEEFDRLSGNAGIPTDVIIAASKDPGLKKAWRVLMKARIRGVDMAEFAEASSMQEVQDKLNELAEVSGIPENIFDKTAYIASGGDVALETQIQNFLTYYYIKSVQHGHSWVYAPAAEATINQETGQVVPGATAFEARLAADPSKLFFEMLSTGANNPGGVNNASLIIANQSMNWAMSSDMAQKNLASIVFSELTRGHPVAELLFSSLCCPFVQYKTNAINNMLGWVLPMSSINLLLNRYVASYSQNPEGTGIIKRWVFSGGQDTRRAAFMKNVGAQVEMTMPLDELRMAVQIDALRLGTMALAMALFGCAAFEPPETPDGEPDEEKMGNVEEWTIFGHRIGSNWWLQDTLGLALPYAAMWKATSMGYHRLDLLTNGIAHVLYMNPALRVSDAVAIAFNADYDPEDYTMAVDMAANAQDGSPDKLDWLLNSWQATGLTWVCQFFTPSILKEIYQHSQMYEKSYKKVVRVDEQGHAILDANGNYQYEYTDYTDMVLRKAAKQNPMIGIVLDFIKDPTGDETGYRLGEMPDVIYYDELQLEMMKKYSLYERDEYGDYVLKNDDAVQAGVMNIISTMQQYDDMKELASTGFYLDYNTKAYMSKWIWDYINQLQDAYYSGYDAGAFNEYVLGQGNYQLGQYLAAGNRQSYWDEINYWKSFYYDKLWSKDLGSKLQEYKRYSTTYLRDSSGNFYASGMRNDLFRAAPFHSAPEEGYTYTSGAEDSWASISALTGEPMYDENGNPMRALIPQSEAAIPTPRLDSWENYDPENPGAEISAASTIGSAAASTGNGSRVYPSSGGYGGGSGSGGGYSRGGGGGGRNYNPYGALTPNMSRLYDVDPEQIYSPKQSRPQFDYLRPSYQTKGSREAYRREDF